MKTLKKMLVLAALFFAAVTVVSQTSFARTPTGDIDISIGA